MRYKKRIVEDGVRLALASLHRDLKVRLWRERACAKTGKPTCDYCGLPIKYPGMAVAHHWLIRRAYLPVKEQHRVEHEYNICLLHTDCSDQHESTVRCKRLCAEAQYERYGRETVVAWVESLGLKQHVEIP